MRRKESDRVSLETELRQVKQQVEEQKENIKNNENGESTQSRDLHVHVYVYGAFALIPYSQNNYFLKHYKNRSSLRKNSPTQLVLLDVSCSFKVSSVSISFRPRVP